MFAVVFYAFVYYVLLQGAIEEFMGRAESVFSVSHEKYPFEMCVLTRNKSLRDVIVDKAQTALSMMMMKEDFNHEVC